MKIINLKSYRFWLVYLLSVSVLLIFAQDAAASPTIGSVASGILKTLGAVGKLITAGSYIAGLAFAIGAIMKFKQHKDNPTQIPIGTPISLVFVAAALLFLPTLMSTLGQTMFGGQQKTAGASGTIITK